MIYRTAAEKEPEMKKPNKAMVAIWKTSVGAGIIFGGVAVFTVGIYFIGLVVGEWLLGLNLSKEGPNEYSYIVIPWLFGFVFLLSPFALFRIAKFFHSVGEDFLAKK